MEMQPTTVFVLGCIAVVCLGSFQVKGQTLLLAQRNEIVQLNTSDWSNKSRQRWTQLIRADDIVKSFDLNPAWDLLYWATDYRIYRTPLYDLNTTTALASTGRVGCLVLDWIHRRLYWTDLDTRRIETVRLDGTGRRVVYQTYGELGALAVDCHMGRLFWIEQNRAESNLPTIKSTTISGSIVQTVYTSGDIQEDSPLVIDPGYNSIYFYQTNDSLVQQWEINYAGIEPHIKLFERKDLPVKSLVLAGKRFFFTTGDGLFLGQWIRKRYTLVYGNNTDDFMVLDPYFELLNDTLSDVSQIRLLTKDVQLSPLNECSDLYCEEECLMDQRPSCSCSFGHSLNSDNQTCSDQGYLFYGSGTTFGRIRLDRSENTILYNDSFANIQSFDVHIKTKSVYWADLSKQTISRAPVESPIRSQVILSNVSAYGIAVDWVHGHLYWTDQSSIVTSTLDGEKITVLLQNLDSPAEIAVDPINRYIFWIECGRSLSLRRAGLSGNDVTVLRSHMTCGANLLPDPKRVTLYWRDWTGAVHSLGYDGSYSMYISEFTAKLSYNYAVWAEDGADSVDDAEEFFFSSYDMLKNQDIEVNAVKLISTSQQLEAPNLCAVPDCPGLCFPSPKQAEPVCLCAGDNLVAVPCQTLQSTVSAGTTGGSLEIVGVTPFSITLICTGSLLRNPFMRPFLEVTETDSLVPRDGLPKHPRVVQVLDKNLPFTIDSLNPATTYTVSVRNRVTRASLTLTVHTAPPPLAVQRLPVVTVAAAESPITWRPQDVHYTSPNVWENLLHREFVLLLMSNEVHSSSTSVPIKEEIMELLQREVDGSFVVLNYYKSKEDFDDDPEMYLGNLPWGEEFWVAMVQVTSYKDVYHLDIIYSDSFALPDPHWNSLLHDIFDDY